MSERGARSIAVLAERASGHRQVEKLTRGGVLGRTRLAMLIYIGPALKS